MKNLKTYILSTFVGLVALNNANAFEIGGVGLGAKLHIEEFENYETINGINKIMLSFGGDKVRDELDFLAEIFQDLIIPLGGAHESIATGTGASHKIRSIAFLQNDKHVYVNMRDRIVDDMYVYGFDYVPFSSMASVDGELVVRQAGECTDKCYMHLGTRPGYVPILRGVSLDSSDMNDHEISEIEAFIDSENVLTVSLDETGEKWKFKFIVQIAWINQAFFSGQHFEVTNAGNAVKGSHNYVRPDETSDRAVLKGFKLKYVKDEAGTSIDSHYVKDIIIDLENGFVEFNDGDRDDYFEYTISYATIY